MFLTTEREADFQFPNGIGLDPLDMTFTGTNLAGLARDEFPGRVHELNDRNPRAAAYAMNRRGLQPQETALSRTETEVGLPVTWNVILPAMVTLAGSLLAFYRAGQVIAFTRTKNLFALVAASVL